MGYSPDKMLQARLISYPDTHRYRLGVNYDARADPAYGEAVADVLGIPVKALAVAT